MNLINTRIFDIWHTFDGCLKLSGYAWVVSEVLTDAIDRMFRSGRPLMAQNGSMMRV